MDLLSFRTGGKTKRASAEAEALKGWDGSGYCSGVQV
jgi:hypothetical protein